MNIHWNDNHHIWARNLHTRNGVPGEGIVLEPLAPFKGICDHCGKRKVVRHYPWSLVKWFGTFCKPCIDRLDNELAEVCYADPEY